FVLLGEIEVVVLALERQRAPIFAVLACEQLSRLDAGPEPLRGAAQLELRVDVELARDIHRSEEDIAELFGPALLRAEILLQLAELVEQLVVVARKRGIRDLVRLLDGVRHDRARRLLAVPRAVATQPLRQELQVEKGLLEALHAIGAPWTPSAEQPYRLRRCS